MRQESNAPEHLRNQAIVLRQGCIGTEVVPLGYGGSVWQGFHAEICYHVNRKWENKLIISPETKTGELFCKKPESLGWKNNLVQRRLGGRCQAERQLLNARPKGLCFAKGFTQRVADFWSSLSQEVVLAEHINSLKNGSDNYINGRH